MKAPVAEAPAPVAEPSRGPKVIDKIDLSQFEKKPAKVEKPVEPVVAPEPEPEPAPAPTPVAAPTPAEEPAQKVVEEAPVKAEPREVKIEVERLAGPKVVDTSLSVSARSKRSSTLFMPTTSLVFTS